MKGGRTRVVAVIPCDREQSTRLLYFCKYVHVVLEPSACPDGHNGGRFQTIPGRSRCSLIIECYLLMSKFG